MRQTDDQPAGGAADDRSPYRSSRRTILRGGLGAAGISLLAVAEGHAFPAPRPAGSPTPDAADVAVFPRPGSRTASPGTEITFRGAPVAALGTVTVTGAESGVHSGLLLPHSDERGASFLPDAPFKPAESVTVLAGVRLGATADGSVSFTVARPAPSRVVPATQDEERSGEAPRTFRSRPDLMPPPITVTTPAAEPATGHIFVAVKSPDGQDGPMILDERGELVWFAPLAGELEQANTLRVQRYRGQPVLTWWEGVSESGEGLGHFVMLDSSYQEIASLQVGNGYPGADLHEFLLTPQGTALIIVYNPVRWDLSPVGGSRAGVALDGIVQELDVETGRVLFEWHSLEHIGLDESYGEPPADANEIFDYFHLNSIEVDHDGNLILSARNSWGVYKIDRWTGDVLWRLNGTQSSFAMGEGTAFAYQHDARVHPTGELTLFDNAASTQDADIPSRGVVLVLDTDAMTATLVREYIHPTNILSVSQGNMQMLPNGNAFVGWGSAPVFSEFDRNGTVRFNGRFPTHVNSYRAYSDPWIGQPSDAPAVVAEQEDGNAVTVYVSWNGATEIASWQVLAGPDPDRLQVVGSAPRAGFETAITVKTAEPYLAVVARDRSGQVLGISAAVEAGN